MASSIEDDLRYTPSDCFETFPLPEQYEQNEALEQAGRAYYGFRAALMVRNNEGLTKTYNRFHGPDQYAPEIAELRRLHAAMDRAVLAAYGWDDLLANDRPPCDFSLNSTKSKRTTMPRQKAARNRRNTAIAGTTISTTRCWPACSP